jgi:hypothetical protein
MRDAMGESAVLAEDEDFVPIDDPGRDADLPFVVEEE